MRDEKPMVALVMGDPAGIAPELSARLLAHKDATAMARVVVVGDREVLRDGERVAGVRLDIAEPEPFEWRSAGSRRPVLFNPGHRDAVSVPRATASAAGGGFAMRNLTCALGLAREGEVDAICFTPLNKEALKLAGNPYPDEIRWAADQLGFSGRCAEYNRLGDLWNARVTSHVPMAEVPRLLTHEAIVAAIEDADRTLRAAGNGAPRIAVAGYNPHAGEGGLFGREEIEVIRPATEDCAARGFDVVGPFPADTVWLRTRRGDFDVVVTMYHDQGQIALKLMGFDRGVTILGGLPVPITTPAHGTAFDIAGSGKADPGATIAAFRTAVSMALARESAAQAPQRTDV